MKNIDGEKLWAYLENRFNVLCEQYDNEREKAKNAILPDEKDDILHSLITITGKCNFIIELKNDILSGRFTK